jgi:protein phosphatase PTC7
MAACGYAFRRAELGAAKRQPDKDPSAVTRPLRIAAMGSVGSAARPDVSFRYRGVECCKKVGATLKCRELWGNRTFWTNAAGPGSKLSYAVEPWVRDFSRLCVAPYSAGATEHQLSLDEKMDNSTVASDGYVFSLPPDTNYVDAVFIPEWDHGVYG